MILLWLSGGLSHIDSWDPKPEATQQVRGPYGTIATRMPGVRFCEHLPRQAAIMDKLTVIRSVDCSASTHTPITMQAGNPLARRTDNGRDGDGYPSMGSIAAKFRGPNDPSLPAFVGLADSWKADVWGAGNLGSAYQPVEGNTLAGRFDLPRGVTLDRLNDRDSLRRQMDHFRAEMDQSGTMEHFDQYTRQAVDMVTSGQRGGRSTSRRKILGCVTRTAATAWAKRHFWLAAWSRRGSRSSWSAARGAISITMEITSSGVGSRKA